MGLYWDGLLVWVYRECLGGLRERIANWRKRKRDAAGERQERWAEEDRQVDRRD